MSTYNSNRTPNRRPVRRKQKVRLRYDRIAAVAVIFILLIILLVACTKSCGGDSKIEETDESSVVPTETDAVSQDIDTSGASTDSAPSKLDNYKTIEEMPGAVFEGDLILVNKQHEYSFPASSEEKLTMVYENKSDVYSVADLETYLTPDTIEAINGLLNDFSAEKNHSDCMVISGFRTKEYQDNLFDSGTTDIKGGCSDYHTGMSFDLGVYPEGASSYYYVPEGDYSWIQENCAKYGLVTRFPEGKESATGVSESKTYQFRYVGIPHAMCMAENGLCLEEYIEYVKNYTYDGDHLKVATDNGNYEIYYVKADPSGNTQVPVPNDDKDYTISGNNVDGFIITVDMSGSGSGSSNSSDSSDSSDTSDENVGGENAEAY